MCRYFSGPVQDRACVGTSVALCRMWPCAGRGMCRYFSGPVQDGACVGTSVALCRTGHV